MEGQGRGDGAQGRRGEFGRSDGPEVQGGDADLGINAGVEHEADFAREPHQEVPVGLVGLDDHVVDDAGGERGRIDHVLGRDNLHDLGVHRLRNSAGVGGHEHALAGVVGAHHTAQTQGAVVAGLNGGDLTAEDCGADRHLGRRGADLDLAAGHETGLDEQSHVGVVEFDLCDARQIDAELHAQRPQLSGEQIERHAVDQDDEGLRPVTERAQAHDDPRAGGADRFVGCVRTRPVSVRAGRVAMLGTDSTEPEPMRSGSSTPLASARSRQRAGDR